MKEVKNLVVNIEIKDVEVAYEIMEYLNDDQLLKLMKWMKEKKEENK